MSYPAPRGHERAMAALRGLRAHALLFTGPEGVGRRQVARWYGALLNCAAVRDAPCGGCASCRLLLAGNHPDYREIGPAETTSSGRLSRRPEIRIGQLVEREGEDAEPLSRWLGQRPRFARRVGVVDRAETLNQHAANAFLKTLEEPPSYALIILVAPSREAVLPTLASRCALVRFGAVATDAYADLAPHPALRLGRIGPLEQARADGARFEELRAQIEDFVRALPQDLEAALEATEGLEKAWLGRDETAGTSAADLLRERLRALPAPLYAAAHDAIDRAEEALAAYAAAGPTLQRLTLELRRDLGRHGLREL